MASKKTSIANIPKLGTTSQPMMHGVMRGLNPSSDSPMFGGFFGRMFPTLKPASFFVEDLDALAEEIVASAEEEVTGENEKDAEESRNINAGMTYLGQFIDHDITFDPASSLQKQMDPNQLIDFRTPRFDLDNVYGRGPADQPYLYEDDGRHFKLGRRLTGAERFDKNARDLPRHKSDTSRPRALIGDPRNDENVIIAQLHAIFLRFHNTMVDFLAAGTDFKEIQQQVRWHYQWVVLNDFLLAIVGWDVIHGILPHLKKNKPVREVKADLRFFKFKKEPFIPVEFSVAAYRFGHSMVRPQYRLSTSLITGGPEGNGRIAIFTPEDSENGLNGFREFPQQWAIDWSLYFDTGNKAPELGIERVQPAYKIDSSLVDPLRLLQRTETGDAILSLAKRNLLRSLRLGLPSGQDVAKKMGIKPIADKDLRVGKATEEDSPENSPITNFGDSFKNRAPLWFYILAEAQQQFQDDESHIILGPVGGRIVAEVFIGLLVGDSSSFLRKAPNWKPEASFLNKDGKFGIAELIKTAVKAH